MPLHIEDGSGRTRTLTASGIEAAPPLNPRESRGTYSDYTSIHERADIKRNVGQAPPVRPLFRQGQTPGKNRTKFALISSFTLSMQSDEQDKRFSGIKVGWMARLAHRIQARRQLLSDSRAWPKGARCGPKPTCCSTTCRYKPAREAVASCSTEARGAAVAAGMDETVASAYVTADDTEEK